MKAPLSWLKDYVDIACSPEELKNKLFSCGFEVEDMIYTAGGIDKIVSCKIIEIEKHPNADKLSVTKVDAGKYGILQIVTAATNIFVGAVVPVALDGSTLFNGEKIKTGKLRGVESCGMFCSGEELGITDDWYKGASVYGILILSEDMPLGEEVKNLLDLDDVIFDINVTANRPDCQSIFGLAREVAAVLKKHVKEPDFTYTVDENLSTKKIVKVIDNAPDLCPRYISHYVSDIKIEESPLWLKRRLFRMGLRSINNVVDITNFVLLELGQPMHAFDKENIVGNEIIIRRATENEKIITLDEKEFTLNENNLVICDTSKPIAIAGVMGGLNSEIKDTSKSVLFESAKFARDNVRKTSRTLGQRTDASSRYEKGVDAYTVELGMKRALNLIDKLKCGKIACDEYDLCYEKLENKIINTTFSKINAVLGIEVSHDIIEEILTNLNFEVKINGDDISVKIPLYREDMDDYPDIAEEIIREYGYDYIEPTLLKTSKITSGGKTLEQKQTDSLKNLLTGFGFNEMITYSFVSEKDFDLFKVDKDSNERNFVKIINPLGEDLMVMRTMLLPSAVKIACSNIARKNFEGRLFELAKTYYPKQVPMTELPEEREALSMVIFGENEDFFTLKGVVDGIIESFCYGARVKYEPCNLKRMHPTRAANVYVDGKFVGYFGQINPEIIDKLDVDKPVYGGELDYERLKNHFNTKISYKNVSKFPQVERDLAISVDKNVSCGDIMDVIKSSGGKHLEKLSLFDVYEGEQIEKGKKSMAFNLVFVSDEKTLEVEEIENAIKKILKNLKREFDADLR